MEKKRHPGGKLLEKGAKSLSDDELLSILIGAGIRGKPAEDIGKEIIEKFHSFRGLANQPLEELMKIKGLKKVKVIRIAAAFEIARRIVHQISKDMADAEFSIKEPLKGWDSKRYE